MALDPISSVPATFTVGNISQPNLSGTQIVTFSGLTGTYVSATWTVTGTTSLPMRGPNSATISTGTGYVDVAGFGVLAPSPFNVTVNASPNLTDINTAAAGSGVLTAEFSYTDAASGVINVTSLELTVVAAGTGGSPVGYTLTATAFNAMGGPCDDGCNPLTIQMYDSSGKAANAPAGGQTFTFSTTCSGGSFNPAILVIPSGSSSGTDTYCNQETGTCNVTVIPGAGPLSGVASQTIPVFVCGAATDPNTALCSVTRPLIREAIRINMGIQTPLQMGLGNVGDEPKGWRSPTNADLNQHIGNALRIINTEANLHTVLNWPITVPGYPATWQGPAFLSLLGDNECPTRLSINNVQRAVFTDVAGNIYHLRARSHFDHDRNLQDYDETYAASYPLEYDIPNATTIALWPAPSTSGTLTLYVEGAFTNFNSDNDVLDQLPIDHQLCMEDTATLRAVMTRPNEPNYADLFKLYSASSGRGIVKIRLWWASISQAVSVGLVVDKGRRRRVR